MLSNNKIGFTSNDGIDIEYYELNTTNICSKFVSITDNYLLIFCNGDNDYQEFIGIKINN